MTLKLTSQYFIETRLDLGIPPSSGGPEFKTSTFKVGSGFEHRAAGRSDYLFKGDIGKCILDERQIAYLTAFFHARKGRATGFRWKYWADYRCTYEPEQVDEFTRTQGVCTPIEVIGYPANKVFQLQKRYSNFGVDSHKTIYKPVEGTLKVYVNGTEVDGWFCDYTRGLVAFNTPVISGSKVAWDGEFDLPVRFDSDKLSSYTEFIDPATNSVFFRFDSLPIVEILDAKCPFPLEKPTFSGGQCTGLYEVNITHSGGGEPPNTFTVDHIYGPVAGVRIRYGIGFGTYGPTLEVGYSILCHGHHFVFGGPFNTQGRWSYQDYFGYGGGFGGIPLGYTSRLNWVKPMAGHPDNCGDLPAVCPMGGVDQKMIFGEAP